MKTVTTINLLNSVQFATLATISNINFLSVEVSDLPRYGGLSCVFANRDELFLVIDKNGKALTGEDVVCLVGE